MYCTQPRTAISLGLTERTEKTNIKTPTLV